jgi:hypothetical protein
LLHDREPAAATDADADPHADGHRNSDVDADDSGVSDGRGSHRHTVDRRLRHAGGIDFNTMEGTTENVTGETWEWTAHRKSE